MLLDPLGGSQEADDGFFPLGPLVTPALARPAIT
jgi:hypothetical protein